MNDMCFSRCLIKNIQSKTGMKILACLTKVPTENGLVDASLFVYMKNEVFDKRNEKSNFIAVNKELSFIGKTELIINNNTIRFNVLVQNSRRIVYPSKFFSIETKVVDVKVNKLISKRNKDRIEIICKYDANKNANDKLIVSIDSLFEPLLKENSSYNISGTFLLRNGNLPLVVAKTFVPDIIIDENVYIRGL